MRRNLGIIAYLVIVNAFLPVFAQAAQPSITERSASVSISSDRTTGYPPPSIATKEGQDCEGRMSKAGAGTALFRRLHGTEQKPGVQCPIPPIPEHQQSQERHE